MPQRNRQVSMLPFQPSEVLVEFDSQVSVTSDDDMTSNLTAQSCYCLCRPGVRNCTQERKPHQTQLSCVSRLFSEAGRLLQQM
jgi:hypothetical protein